MSDSKAEPTCALTANKIIAFWLIGINGSNGDFIVGVWVQVLKHQSIFISI